MNPRKPWQPKMDDTERTWNPSASPVSDREGILDTPQIRDPEDSTPLQGSKDLSDDDSLEDVIADDADDDSSIDPVADRR